MDAARTAVYVCHFDIEHNNLYILERPAIRGNVKSYGGEGGAIKACSPRSFYGLGTINHTSLFYFYAVQKHRGRSAVELDVVETFS